MKLETFTKVKYVNICQSRRCYFFFGSALLLILFYLFFFTKDTPKPESQIQLSLSTFFDSRKAATNQNYPICSKIHNLQNEIHLELKNSKVLETEYNEKLNSNYLNCGVVRVGLGFIFKRKNLPWIGCSEEILPAKKRLIDHIENLCERQKEANLNHHHSSSEIPRVEGFPPGRKGVIFTGKAEHLKDIYQASLALRIGLGIPPPQQTSNEKPENSEEGLEIEVWVNGRDSSLCSHIFSPLPLPLSPLQSQPTSSPNLRPLETSISKIPPSPSDLQVTCRVLPDFVRGFASKFYALLLTHLDHVLFVDADNLPVGDIREVLRSPGYRETGMVLWPDLWGEQCRERELERERTHSGLARYAGDSGFSSHVLWKEHFAGLNWSSIRAHSQEAEAGQIALDLTRHKGLLNLAREMIEDDVFFKRIVNGDKDLFRLVHLMVGEPFLYVPHLPAYSTSFSLPFPHNLSTLSDSSNLPPIPAFDRDCLVHFFDFPAHSTPYPYSFFPSEPLPRPQVMPLFYHQLKQRKPHTFSSLIRLPLSQRGLPSSCLSTDRQVSPIPAPYSPQLFSLEDQKDLTRLSPPTPRDQNPREQEPVFWTPEDRLVQESLHLFLGPDGSPQSREEGRALVRFASEVFSLVDSEWERRGLDGLVDRHRRNQRWEDTQKRIIKGLKEGDGYQIGVRGVLGWERREQFILYTLIVSLLSMVGIGSWCLIRKLFLKKNY